MTHSRKFKKIIGYANYNTKIKKLHQEKYQTNKQKESDTFLPLETFGPQQSLYIIGCTNFDMFHAVINTQ